MIIKRWRQFTKEEKNEKNTPRTAKKNYRNINDAKTFLTKKYPKIERTAEEQIEKKLIKGGVEEYKGGVEIYKGGVEAKNATPQYEFRVKVHGKAAIVRGGRF